MHLGNLYYIMKDNNIMPYYWNLTEKGTNKYVCEYAHITKMIFEPDGYIRLVEIYPNMRLIE
jgi:hypothetical protein